METWVPVYGFKNYEVSNMGNVRRTSHIAKHARYGDRKLPERMLNPKKNGDGYWRVKIGKQLKFVHVLVLESFVCPRPKGMQVCHNNGKPDDNKLENLRWDTPRNNVLDRKSHGTYQWGANNPMSKSWQEKRANGRYEIRVEDIS